MTQSCFLKDSEKKTYLEDSVEARVGEGIVDDSYG